MAKKKIGREFRFLVAIQVDSRRVISLIAGVFVSSVPQDPQDEEVSARLLNCTQKQEGRLSGSRPNEFLVESWLCELVIKCIAHQRAVGKLTTAKTAHKDEHLRIK